MTARSGWAVNVEGMKYDHWPVARLIERELSCPLLLTRYRRKVARPEKVTEIWARDAWQVSARRRTKEANLAPTRGFGGRRPGRTRGKGASPHGPVLIRALRQKPLSTARAEWNQLLGSDGVWLDSIMLIPVSYHRPFRTSGWFKSPHWAWTRSWCTGGQAPPSLGPARGDHAPTGPPSNSK